MRILVTGGAGYIGTLLIRRLLKENILEQIIGIDLLPQPKRIPASKKLFWITSDLAKDGWQNQIVLHAPLDAVVHLAFKIRSPYGKAKKTSKQNVTAAEKVFRFAFDNKVPKLIYTSSVAAYGAREENIGVLLKENDPLQEEVSPYGAQKREVEVLLQKLIRTRKPETHTIVLRLGSVTGPFGQNLKSKLIGLVTFLKKLLPFVIEANRDWARQFVHEKDVENLLIAALKKNPEKSRLNIYNVAPPSILLAKDIAHLLKKKTLRFPSALVRPAFWLAWHCSLGIIPTHPDSANGLIYPINVDGSGVKSLGFEYRFTAADALLGKE